MFTARESVGAINHFFKWLNCKGNTLWLPQEPFPGKVLPGNSILKMWPHEWRMGSQELWVCKVPVSSVKPCSTSSSVEMPLRTAPLIHLWIASSLGQLCYDTAKARAMDENLEAHLGKVIWSFWVPCPLAPARNELRGMAPWWGGNPRKRCQSTFTWIILQQKYGCLLQVFFQKHSLNAFRKIKTTPGCMLIVENKNKQARKLWYSISPSCRGGSLSLSTLLT